MFNLTRKQDKERYRIEMLLSMIRFEKIFSNEIRMLLNRQYLDTAFAVEQGMITEYVQIVEEQRKRFKKIYTNHGKRIGKYFNDKVISNIEKNIIPSDIKDQKDEFWDEMMKWLLTVGGKKITQIQETTKGLLATIIYMGMGEGLSHRDIAKKIRKTGRISNPRRALTIARTETHTAAVKATDASVKSTRIEFEKEWISAFDERTRSSHVSANGERVQQDGIFISTGEDMRYPGDERGSAWNVVNCRCIVQYHSI